MPQMMPINWMMSFFFFIIIFITFNIINYYIFNYNYKTKNFPKMNKIEKKMNWKW